jgi:hypothetical protein
MTWRQLVPGHRIPVIAKTPLLVALGVSWAGGADNVRGVWLSMALATALWLALYALNECTDAALEEGYIGELRLRRWLVLVSVVIVSTAGAVSVRLLIPMALMAASQLAYCLPPVRLKRWWWGGVLLSGVVNPTARLLCGAVWGTHPVPGLAYGALVCLHVGGAIRTRTLQRKRDLSLSYRVPPPGTEFLGLACTAMGILGAYRLCGQGMLPPALSLFVAPGGAFAAYAWCRRGLSIRQLRQGWIPFALLSIAVLVALLIQPLYSCGRSDARYVSPSRGKPGCLSPRCSSPSLPGWYRRIYACLLPTRPQ